MRRAINKYHIETQSTLPLCLEHDPIHDAHCWYILISSRTHPYLTMTNPRHAPVNIFLYHVKISSFETLTGRSRSFCTSTPSESMILYVGIFGISDGLIKDMLVVNLLLTAPGNRTLFRVGTCQPHLYVSSRVCSSEP